MNNRTKPCQNVWGQDFSGTGNNSKSPSKDQEEKERQRCVPSEEEGMRGVGGDWPVHGSPNNFGCEKKNARVLGLCLLRR